MMKLSALALAVLPMNPVSIGVIGAGAATFASPQVAVACEINCNQPTAVDKGKKVPVWHVVDCMVGPEGGPYTRVDCKSKEAVHISPRGEEVVCFLGSDNKIHWDYQWAVQVGKTFINRKVGGVWMPDWQE